MNLKISQIVKYQNISGKEVMRAKKKGVLLYDLLHIIFNHCMLTNKVLNKARASKKYKCWHRPRI